MIPRYIVRYSVHLLELTEVFSGQMFKETLIVKAHLIESINYVEKEKSFDITAIRKRSISWIEAQKVKFSTAGGTINPGRVDYYEARRFIYHFMQFVEDPELDLNLRGNMFRRNYNGVSKKDLSTRILNFTQKIFNLFHKTKGSR